MQTSSGLAWWKTEELPPWASGPGQELDPQPTDFDEPTRELRPVPPELLRCSTMAQRVWCVLVQLDRPPTREALGRAFQRHTGRQVNRGRLVRAVRELEEAGLAVTVGVDPGEDAGAGALPRGTAHPLTRWVIPIGLFQ